MTMKKHSFWLVALSLIMCLSMLFCSCSLFNPDEDEDKEKSEEEAKEIIADSLQSLNMGQMLESGLQEYNISFAELLKGVMAEASIGTTVDGEYINIYGGVNENLIKFSAAGEDGYISFTDENMILFSKYGNGYNVSVENISVSVENVVGSPSDMLSAVTDIIKDFKFPEIKANQLKEKDGWYVIKSSYYDSVAREIIDLVIDIMVEVEGADAYVPSDDEINEAVEQISGIIEALGLEIGFSVGDESINGFYVSISTTEDTMSEFFGSAGEMAPTPPYDEPDYGLTETVQQGWEEDDDYWNDDEWSETPDDYWAETDGYWDENNDYWGGNDGYGTNNNIGMPDEADTTAQYPDYGYDYDYGFGYDTEYGYGYDTDYGYDYDYDYGYDYDGDGMPDEAVTADISDYEGLSSVRSGSAPIKIRLEVMLTDNAKNLKHIKFTANIPAEDGTVTIDFVVNSIIQKNDLVGIEANLNMTATDVVIDSEYSVETNSRDEYGYAEYMDIEIIGNINATASLVLDTSKLEGNAGDSIFDLDVSVNVSPKDAFCVDYDYYSGEETRTDVEVYFPSFNIEQYRQSVSVGADITVVDNDTLNLLVSVGADNVSVSVNGTIETKTCPNFGPVPADVSNLIANKELANDIAELEQIAEFIQNEIYYYDYGTLPDVVWYDAQTGLYVYVSNYYYEFLTAMPDYAEQIFYDRATGEITFPEYAE